MRKRRKRSRFGLALFLYALVLALLSAGVLVFFNAYLKVYEQTRPAAALSAWMETLRSGGSEACEAALSPLDPALCPAEDRRAFLNGLLADAVSRESMSRSTDTEKVYVLSSGALRFGTVTLVQKEAGPYGLRGWQVDREEYDFSPCFGTVSVTAPDDYRVLVNGHMLDSSYVVQSGLPYETLAPLYDSIEGLPRLRRYESGLCLGTPVVTLLDAQGREVPEGAQNEAVFLANCSEEETRAIRAFAESFLQTYILFTANIEMEQENYFSPLMRMVAADSPLATRLRRSIADEWWSNTSSCTLQELEPHFCTRLPDGRYLSDLRYRTRTVALGDPVVADYNVRMLLRQEGDRLLAEALYYY